jgi:hypothetical protein
MILISHPPLPLFLSLSLPFIITLTSYDELPTLGLPEVAFLGRSNVGEEKKQFLTLLIKLVLFSLTHILFKALCEARGGKSEYHLFVKIKIIKIPRLVSTCIVCGVFFKRLDDHFFSFFRFLCFPNVQVNRACSMRLRGRRKLLYLKCQEERNG